jgi:hypothetical protein
LRLYHDGIGVFEADSIKVGFKQAKRLLLQLSRIFLMYLIKVILFLA